MDFDAILCLSICGLLIYISYKERVQAFLGFTAQTG